MGRWRGRQKSAEDAEEISWDEKKREEQKG
jgi:hypothetical protein